MEHLQKQANTNPNADVHAPQEVIDALVTLTRAGLLSWRQDRTVRPTFELEADNLMLNHLHDEDEDDVAGYYMHITREQVEAITQAVELEKQDLAAANAAGNELLPAVKAALEVAQKSEKMMIHTILLTPQNEVITLSEKVSPNTDAWQRLAKRVDEQGIEIVSWTGQEYLIDEDEYYGDELTDDILLESLNDSIDYFDTTGVTVQ